MTTLKLTATTAIINGKASVAKRDTKKERKAYALMLKQALFGKTN